MKSEAVGVKRFFFDTGRIFRTALSIAPSPSRICRVVEVLKRIEADCRIQKSFTSILIVDVFLKDDDKESLRLSASVKATVCGFARPPWQAAKKLAMKLVVYNITA